MHEHITWKILFAIKISPALTSLQFHILWCFWGLKFILAMSFFQTKPMILYPCWRLYLDCLTYSEISIFGVILLLKLFQFCIKNEILLSKISYTDCLSNSQPFHFQSTILSIDWALSVWHEHKNSVASECIWLICD